MGEEDGKGEKGKRDAGDGLVRVSGMRQVQEKGKVQ
jgi:hypothetical protein